MKRNVMKRNALLNTKEEGNNVWERKSGGRSQTAKRVVMTTVSIIGVVLLIGAMVEPLCAQSYPDRPIRLIVPNVPGGAADTLGRLVGKKLSEQLGQPVMIENRAGAGGNIANETTKKSRPDGYTIVLGTSTLVVSPGLFKKLNYDPIKDFAPISLVAKMPFLLDVRSSWPINSLKELVEYAKANPGKVNFGSNGIGSVAHLAGEMLKNFAKINIVHVPYKGGSQLLVALLGGEVEVIYVGPSTSLPQIQAGKVKALAVLDDRRVPILPDVPTAREAGIDNYEVVAFYGLLAPAGTPRGIINRLNEAWVKSAALPDTKKQMDKLEFIILSGTSEQFSEYLKTETVRWTKIIKDANVIAQD